MPPTAAGRRARLAPGERVYAVGDIHGRRDLLIAIETLIADDMARQPPGGETTVVYLGDYVDRGAESRGVLDTLIGLPPAPLRRRFLLGNHDWWLRQFLEGGGPLRTWLQSGGDSTLRSYGVSAFPRLDQPGSIESARRQLLRRMPPAHARFLSGLLPMYRQGDYLFVHAGIRPGIAIAIQEIHDLAMIREPFLSEPGDLGVVVVHGHSVVENPIVRPNRIAIDTGAYWSGRLTALVLEGDTHRFIGTGSRG